MSIVKVLDNSGAQTARCIKILEPKGKKYAEAGDLILVSIQTLKGNTGSLSKGDIFKAVVLQTNKPRSGSGLDKPTYRADYNSVCLVKVQAKTGEYVPVGTRLKGPITADLQNKPKFQKIVSLSKAAF